MVMNDQFSIPGQPSEHQQALHRQAVHVAGEFQRTPENKEVYYFARIKELEARVHSYRKTALEIEGRREPTFTESLLGGKRSKVTLHGLIDRESYIGGRVYGENIRFWLDHKGSSVLSNGNDIGDWHFVQAHIDQFGTVVGETRLHFETHPAHVHKLHDGRPVQPTIAELETLIHAIELYEEFVRAELYPFDQEIFDLLSEIDEENFVVPDTVEEMFGKEVVARVVEEYKRKKGIHGDLGDDYTLAA